MMLRQESSPMGRINREKTAAQKLQDDADIEALRAAYRAVVTATAHSGFAAKARPGVAIQPSEPLLNAYHAAVAAFANSVFEANGLNADMIQTQAPAALRTKPKLQPAPSAIPSHPALEAQSTSQKAQRPAATPAIAQPRVEVKPAQQPSQPSSATPSGKSTFSDQRKAAAAASNQTTTTRTKAQPNTSSTPQTGRKAEPGTRFPAVPKSLYAAEPVPQPEKRAQPEAIQPTQPSGKSATSPEPLPEVPSAYLANEPVPSLLLDDEEFMGLPPIPESWLVKLFNRPKLAAGIIGMCVLTSSVYAGLGLWWLNNLSTSNAAEPAVNMLNLDESEQIHRDNNSIFKNINNIQKQNNIIVPNESPTKHQPQRDLLAMAPASGSFELQDIRRSISEPTGRPDPFEPLLGASGQKEGPPEETKKKDVLEDLQFTGFIGDVNAKDKVAMIKVTDPMAGSAKTLIKKAGQSFLVEGQKVVIKAISKHSLLLSVAGETRVLSLSPYEEIATGTATTAQGTTGAAASGGTAAPTSNTGTNVVPGNLGNIRALSGQNPTNPQLQEPN